MPIHKHCLELSYVPEGMSQLAMDTTVRLVVEQNFRSHVHAFDAQAEGLKGTPRNTHTFVRVRVDAQSQLTSVQWSSLAPRWDEVLTFKCALKTLCMPPVCALLLSAVAAGPADTLLLSA